MGPDSPVDRLPDSLLLYIFELDHGTHAMPPSRFHGEISTAGSIVQVCRRWNQLATPVLYSRIILETHEMVYGWGACRELLATLQQNVGLRALTREVRILLPDYDHPPEDYLEQHLQDFQELRAYKKVVDDVVQLLRWWLPSVQRVSLRGPIEEYHTRRILWQLCKMPLVEIDFSSYRKGLSLAFFLKYFQYSGLKRLSWDGIGWNANPDQLAASWGDSWSDEDDQSLSPGDGEAYYTDLQSLSIVNPEMTASKLQLLFMRCKSLRSFGLRYELQSPHESCNIPALQALFNLHAESLREICLGHFMQPRTTSPGELSDGAMFDVRGMVHLTRLSLNADNVFHLKPAYFAEMVHAPNLRNFDIEYDSEGQFAIYATEIDQPTCNWLVEFSTAWSSQRTLSQTKLSVHLDGYLEFFCDYMFSLELDYGDWPWDGLEIANQSMAENGVPLTWTQPQYTKAEWHGMILRDWEERQLQLNQGSNDEDP